MVNYKKLLPLIIFIFFFSCITNKEKNCDGPYSARDLKFNKWMEKTIGLVENGADISLHLKLRKGAWDFDEKLVMKIENEKELIEFENLLKNSRRHRYPIRDGKEYITYIPVDKICFIEIDNGDEKSFIDMKYAFFNGRLNKNSVRFQNKALKKWIDENIFRWYSKQSKFDVYNPKTEEMNEFKAWYIHRTQWHTKTADAKSKKDD